MRSRIGISILLAFGLSACGGGGAGTATPQMPATTNSQIPNGTGTVTTHSSIAWQAQAGGDHQQGALQALAMLPSTITIDEGDSITWTVQGEVHTITFLPAGTHAPPGDPTVPQGTHVYDGTNFVSSGILAPGQTYTLTFTKAGTYGYQCFLHPPEMSGQVIVQPAGSPYPHPQGFYTGMGTSDLNAILSDAMSSVKTIPFAVSGTTVAVGVAPGGPSAAPNHATVLRFLDGDRLNLTSVTIPLNGIVTWEVLSNNEPHTVTFPAAGQQLPPLPGDPFTPPMGKIVDGQAVYDGTEVTNSGPLGTAVGFPSNSYSMKFTVRGTFPYMCLFHDAFGMMGTVVVK